MFSLTQNEALRAGLKDLRDKRGASQAALGMLLGIGQQSTGRLLNEDGAGFSYATATRLVQALGYATVDTFFRSRGVALAVEESHAKAG